MWRRLILTVGVALLVMAIPASASAALKITKIYYNSPGANSGTDTSLNAEWVQIRNQGVTAVQVGDWKIRDVGGHIYKYPHIRLKAGQSIRLHTGPGFDSFGAKVIHLYWGSDSYIWNNDK